MISRLLPGMICAVVLAACPIAASACDFVYPATPEAREAGARRTIERSAAIIDAEIIRARTPTRPALVRAVRVFKGPSQEVFEIGPERTSCDAGLGGVGTRLRLFLVGGPDLWYAIDTGTDPVYEDRLLGSDRDRDWPVVGVPLAR
jgi:hypothetical protein